MINFSLDDLYFKVFANTQRGHIWGHLCFLFQKKQRKPYCFIFNMDASPPSKANFSGKVNMGDIYVLCLGILLCLSSFTIRGHASVVQEGTSHLLYIHSSVSLTNDIKVFQEDSAADLEGELRKLESNRNSLGEQTLKEIRNAVAKQWVDIIVPMQCDLYEAALKRAYAENAAQLIDKKHTIDQTFFVAHQQELVQVFQEQVVEVFYKKVQQPLIWHALGKNADSAIMEDSLQEAKDELFPIWNRGILQLTYVACERAARYMRAEGIT